MVIRCYQIIANLRNGITCRPLFYFFDEITHSSLTTGDAHCLLRAYHNILQKRWMSKGKRVQDRSKHKRVHELEIATEKWKVVSKILFIMDLLRKEPEHVVPLRNLEQFRNQLNLSKPHKVSDFIRKSPKLFDLYKDQQGVVWCGFTEQAETLVEEEVKLVEENSEKAAEHVTRLLMMSAEKRLPLDKILHFRRDFGLLFDIRKKWIHMFPKHFRAVTIDGSEYLELNSWNPAWAITELEKKCMVESKSEPSSPGILRLPFPMKFPPNFKKVFRGEGKIEHFQKRPYLSPYADASKSLPPGSEEFNKRAVAVIHELLSFTIEKRLVTDHLTHFRREFTMPQKLMRLLLKHYGIFYVSERGKRFSVFLTEAYEGSQLIRKHPLVLWKEKILGLTGYRGRKRGVKNFNEVADLGIGDLFEGELDDQDDFCLDEEESMLAFMECFSGVDDPEIDVRGLYDAII